MSVPGLMYPVFSGFPCPSMHQLKGYLLQEPHYSLPCTVQLRFDIISLLFDTLRVYIEVTQMQHPHNK
jgi:hypothetical protein